MNPVEVVNEQLRLLGAKTGLGDLSLDERRLCTLALGEGDDAVRVTVEVLPDVGRVLLHASVADLGRTPPPRPWTASSGSTSARSERGAARSGSTGTPAR
jgi:hypothetical protein